MSGAPRPFVAAADWGTSHLRLWLLDAAGVVLDERRSAEGMLAAGPAGFAGILERHLSDMNAPAALPAIVCGMAGARQGWVEAPYVTVPAPLATVLEQAVRVPGIVRDVRIVPGLAQRDRDGPDVMRGEETQLAGIAALAGPGRHFVCMPGTHSKWVLVEDGTVVRFATWLTGELYALAASQSILRHSVAGATADTEPDDPHFIAWLDAAVARPGDLASSLFRIRAATLLHDLSPDGAAAALSGLLIGSEIGAAIDVFDPGPTPVALVASGRLGRLYQRALARAGCRVEVTDAETAVRAGLLTAARATRSTP